MQIVDFIIIAFIAYFVVKGAINGFIAALFSLIALFIAFVAVYIFSEKSVALFREYLPDFEFSETLILLILFIAIILIINIVGKLATKISKAMMLSGLNRIFGGIFGAFKSLIMLMALFYLYSISESTFSFKQPVWLSKSIILPYIEEMTFYSENLIRQWH